MIWHTNFDFEYYLYCQKYHEKYIPNLNINNELEYLFLWLPPKRDSTLKTKIKYPKEFLKRTTKVTNSEIKTINLEDSSPWWGNMDNLKEKINLSSKIGAYKFCLQNNINYPTSQIIQDQKDLTDAKIFSKNQTTIFRPEYSFSGRGVKIITSNDENNSLSLPTGIISKYYQRKLDFGFLLNEQTPQVIINQVDDRGSYKGSLYFKKTTDIDQYLRLNNIKQNICNELLNLSAKIKDNNINFEIQSDGFISKEGELFPVIEFNCRKTMGYFLANFTNRYFSDYRISKLIINKYKTTKKTIKLPDNILLLTPQNSYKYKLELYIIFANSFDEISQAEIILKRATN
ncbi:MAG: hypothetical protein HOJ35_03965 [Bdellovibrionales bacterium]|nr:hypothetical protein [Bdellovibrionales bacterium]